MDPMENLLGPDGRGWRTLDQTDGPLAPRNATLKSSLLGKAAK